MKRVLFYLKPHLPRMTVGLVIKFIGTVMDLFLPWILSYMIDDIAPQKDKALIFIWGGVMVLCAVVAVVTNIIANRMAAHVAMLTVKTLRHDLFVKISELSCRQVDEFSIPSLESRLTSDTYNIHQMIGMAQRMGVRAPILLLGGISITLMLEPVLALVLIFVLPFLGAIVFTISKKGIPLYSHLQRGVDAMVRTVRENISGIRVIKALSKSDYEKQRFAEVNAEVTRREKKAGVTMALTNPVLSLFLNFGLTAVILVGAWRVNLGLTQPGKIIAFLTYFTIILNAMLSITRIFVMYSKGSASAARISEVLDIPEDLALQPEPPVQSPYHIVFDRVSFSYHKESPDVGDISFSLCRGEMLGILGPTGCGKSTIVSLLMRLYDVDSGTIHIDGMSIASIPPEDLHTKFGVVFQNDIIFADSIESNINFGRGLSQEDIERAATCAQAMEFISELPDGFSHPLASKGANLSGGQKQRLLIARALAGRPEILVLDDSSSALDYRTDSRFRQALAQSYPNTTAVIIAQRISSIRQADHILVLEDGRELGYGNHSQLLKSCASYREISESQMGGVPLA